MDTKLTLSLDKSIIEKAKAYAISNKVSLSKMIESYLGAVVKSNEEKAKITPLVESLLGVISIEESFDYKKERGDYLIEKHE